MGLFYDSTYLLVILAALISMAVSVRMNTIFSKYQTVRSYSGMTGREAAMRILHQAGIYDVTVRHVSGKLTDHYDPRTKTVNLSDAVYDSTSVAAIGALISLGGMKENLIRSCLNKSQIHFESFLSVFFPLIALTYFG